MQLETLNKKHSIGNLLAYNLVHLWHVLLARAHGAQTAVWPNTAFPSALAAALHLTAVAVPNLNKGRKLAGSNSKISSSLSFLSMGDSIDLTLAVSGEFSHNITAVLPYAVAAWSSTCSGDDQDQQQQILLADKLPDVLLLTLSYQAAKLHEQCADAATAAAEASQVCSDAMSQQSSVLKQHLQQQDSNRQNSKLQQGLINSHNVLMMELGLPSFQADSPCAQRSVFSTIITRKAVELLRQVIVQRKQVARASSNSSDADQHNHQQQQIDKVLPTRLDSQLSEHYWRLLCCSLLMKSASAGAACCWLCCCWTFWQRCHPPQSLHHQQRHQQQQVLLMCHLHTTPAYQIKKSSDGCRTWQLNVQHQKLHMSHSIQYCQQQ